MAKYKDISMPGDLYYFNSDNHVWARIEEGNKVRCGIDQFGQKAAGTVAYVKIKPSGGTVTKGRALGTIEAGKYIGPVKSPFSGTILEVNQAVLDTPGLINTDPYGQGWLVLIESDSLQDDIKDLKHGEEQVQKWLEADYRKYEEEGLFADDKKE